MRTIQEWDNVLGVVVRQVPDEVPAPEVVPQRVTMRQAKLALHRAGKLQLVEDALDALSEPERTEALIEWREATEVARDWPLVVLMTPIIGTDAEVDELFRVAVAL